MKKKDKRTSNNLQNTTQETKDRATRTPLKRLSILCFYCRKVLLRLTVIRYNHFVSYLPQDTTNISLHQMDTSLYQRQIIISKLIFLLVQYLKMKMLNLK